MSDEDSIERLKELLAETRERDGNVFDQMIVPATMYLRLMDKRSEGGSISQDLSLDDVSALAFCFNAISSVASEIESLLVLEFMAKNSFTTNLN